LPAPSVAFYYALIILFLFMKPSKIKKKLAATIAIAFITIACIPSFSSAFAPNLKIRFVDVGQGDCTVVTWPEGGALVVDTGGRYRTFDPGRSIIAPVLWNEQRTKLTALVATHSDRDHIGGTPGLADLVPPNMLYDQGMIKTKSKSYLNFSFR